MSLNITKKEYLIILIYTIIATLIMFLLDTTEFFKPINLIFLFLIIISIYLFKKILTNWELGIWILFIWIIFEDLLRKFMNNNMLIFFIKDIIFIITLFGFIIQKRNNITIPSSMRKLFLPIVILFSWFLVQCFNPSLPNSLVALIGMKSYFLYIPLLFMGYAFINSEKRLIRFLTLIITLAVLVSLGGIFQYYFGLLFLNPLVEPNFLSFLQNKDSLSRLNSVFVHPGRFGLYIFLFFFLTLGTLIYRIDYNIEYGKKNLRTLYTWISLSIISYGAFLSLQKAAVFFIGISLIPLLFVIHFLHKCTNTFIKKETFLFRIIGGIFILSIIVFLIFGTEILQTYDYYTNSIFTLNTLSDRIQLGSGSILHTILNSPLGHGIGTASMGTQYIQNPDDAPLGFMGEGGFGVIIWESGIIGLLIWFFFIASLIATVAKVAIKLAGTHYLGLTLCILLWMFIVLFPWSLTSNTYQNYIVNIHLWFLTGIIFKLPELKNK